MYYKRYLRQVVRAHVFIQFDIHVLAHYLVVGMAAVGVVTFIKHNHGK